MSIGVNGLHIAIHPSGIGIYSYLKIQYPKHIKKTIYKELMIVLKVLQRQAFFRVSMMTNQGLYL